MFFSRITRKLQQTVKDATGRAATETNMKDRAITASAAGLYIGGAIVVMNYLKSKLDNNDLSTLESISTALETTRPFPTPSAMRTHSSFASSKASSNEQAHTSITPNKPRIAKKVI